MATLAASDLDALEQIAADPVAFCLAVLGFEPWAKQAEIMRAVAEDDRVTVRSGHKIGKSTLAAAIALWFCVTRERARVIMTSSVSLQVREILWREVTDLHHRAERRGTPIGGRLALTPDRGLQFDDGRQIFGFTTDESERMAGFSGANMLFIVDEASGVKEKIYEPIEGNRAGGAKLLMLSNPTRTSGTFFDSHHGKAHLYRRFHVSSEQTPNATGGDPIPGLATREWIDEKRDEWGPDYQKNPLYRVRVRGDFPDQSANALIALSDLMQALARGGIYKHLPIDPTWGPLVVGFDVARQGDDESVLVLRRGQVMIALPIVLPRGDGKVLADEAIKIIREFLTPAERLNPGLVTVVVDALGVGWSPLDFLVRAKPGFRIIPFVASARSSVVNTMGLPRYANVRAEVWAVMAEWIKTGVVPDGDGKLEGELVDVQYFLNDKQQLQLEDKDDIKKRLRRSPDRGDALALTFAPDPLRVRRRAHHERGDDVLASV